MTSSRARRLAALALGSIALAVPPAAAHESPTLAELGYADIVNHGCSPVGSSATACYLRGTRPNGAIDYYEEHTFHDGTAHHRHLLPECSQSCSPRTAVFCPNEPETAAWSCHPADLTVTVEGSGAVAGVGERCTPYESSPGFPRATCDRDAAVCPPDCTSPRGSFTTFAGGSGARLHPRPAIGWRFDHWEGCPSTGDGTRADGDICAVQTSAPTTQVRAVFRPGEVARIEAVISPASIPGEGIVRSRPEGIRCPPRCAAEFAVGTDVTLDYAVVPPSWPRFAFSTWTALYRYCTFLPPAPGDAGGTSCQISPAPAGLTRVVANFNEREDPGPDWLYSHNWDGSGKGTLMAIKGTLAAAACGPVIAQAVPAAMTGPHGAALGAGWVLGLCGLELLDFMLDAVSDPPDPRFREVHLPAAVSVPGLPPRSACRRTRRPPRCRAVDAALRRYVAAVAGAIGVREAMAVALNRLTTADAAGERAAYGLQLAALKVLAGELAAAEESRRVTGRRLARQLRSRQRAFRVERGALAPGLRRLTTLRVPRWVLARVSRLGHTRAEIRRDVARVTARARIGRTAADFLSLLSRPSPIRAANLAEYRSLGIGELRALTTALVANDPLAAALATTLDRNLDDAGAACERSARQDALERFAATAAGLPPRTARFLRAGVAPLRAAGAGEPLRVCG